MAKPTLSEISKLFKTDDKPTDFHYYGTVVSADTDNRTYEVSINRDKNITVEAARLVGAHVGDTVMVTVMANGYATVTGRVGGDTDASDAQRKADSASTIADQAQAKAVSALGKAAAAEQLASQAEQNARRSADAAELAEENASKSADYASESKTASEQAQQAAETAQQNAADSQTAAETAQQNAADSQTAAEAARDRAATAEGYADTAQKQAAKAEKEASAANSYAVGALNSLSTTQDIIGVLSWVDERSVYEWDYPLTDEGKEYDPSKPYYTVIGTKVINPIETDYDKYYVERIENEVTGYVKPQEPYDASTEYYTLKAKQVPVSSETDHDSGLYYTLNLSSAQQAMADFIKAHLSLDSEGLYVLKGPHDWRVLVTNDGVYIIDPQGRRVASYKDSITLGTSEGNSIRITSEAITFNIGDKTFAYVAQDKWFASNAEVSGAMYIGDYSLRQKSNGDFVLGRRR